MLTTDYESSFFHSQNNIAEVVTYTNFYDGVQKFGREEVVQNYMVLENDLEGPSANLTLNF